MKNYEVKLTYKGKRVDIFLQIEEDTIISAVSNNSSVEVDCVKDVTSQKINSFDEETLIAKHRKYTF